MAKYENIETVIDRFLEYIRNNKGVSISKAASALAISPSQAERLAILLEQSGFVEIYYGLSDVVVTSKKTEKVLSQAPKAPVENKAIERSREMEREVLTAENLLKFFERDISRRVEIAEQLLKEIEAGSKLSAGDVEKVEREVDLALGQLAAFSSEVKTLSEIEEGFYDQLIGFKKKLHSFKHKESVKQELTLLERIIQWIKLLFAKVNLQVQKPQQANPRKKVLDRQIGVTFVGRGSFQNVKKRMLKLRSGSNRQVRRHYWKKGKRRSSL